MIFTVRVADKDGVQQQSDEVLVFVRLYTVKRHFNEKERARNVTMQHLMLETIPGTKGKQRCNVPSYGVVEASSITQRVCICPHFALWSSGPPKDFLLNDVLDLWPNAYICWAIVR